MKAAKHEKQFQKYHIENVCKPSKLAKPPSDTADRSFFRFLSLKGIAALPRQLAPIPNTGSDCLELNRHRQTDRAEQALLPSGVLCQQRVDTPISAVERIETPETNYSLNHRLDLHKATKHCGASVSTVGLKQPQGLKHYFKRSGCKLFTSAKCCAVFLCGEVTWRRKSKQ